MYSYALLYIIFHPPEEMRWQNGDFCVYHKCREKGTLIKEMTRQADSESVCIDMRS